MKPPNHMVLKRVADAEWVRSMTWLTEVHSAITIGEDTFRANIRATFAGRFCFHYVPDVISTERQRDLLPLLLQIADHHALSTRRPKVAGGGVHRQTRAGTPTMYSYPRRLSALRWAREGFIGFHGTGRGAGGKGCEPTAFTLKHPQTYSQMVMHIDFLANLFREAEPELWERQMEITANHRHLLIGNSSWSQAVSNLMFPMTMHRDSKNVRGSVSAEIVAGDFGGGGLILPEVGVRIALQPSDVLFFDGTRPHGVAPFQGLRASLVAYLHESILRCRPRRVEE
ncbi:MAG: hypothetical protein JWO20_3125 [Candidatus Angelobacter sp.]|nr:hypothetical protein [Candidatus Angelobacter sp.]